LAKIYQPNKSRKTFQQIAGRYAAIVGRRSRGSVPVLFQGKYDEKRACTDGKNILLPSLPAGTVMSTRDYRVFCGFIDHEAGHLRHTDFEPVQELTKEERVEKHLLNVIEDVRMENRVVEYYPGARSDLDFLDEVINQEMKKKMQEEGVSLTVAVAVFASIYRECYWHRGIDNCQFDLPKMEDVKELVPIGKLLTEEMPKLSDTRGSLILARRVKELLPDVDWEEETTPEKMKGEGLPEGDGSGPKMGNEELEELLAQIAEMLDSHEAKDKALVALMSSIEEENQEDNEIKPGQRGTDWFPPLTLENDKILVYPNDNMVEFDRIKAQIFPESRALKKMLGIYLRSRHKRAWNRGMTEGRLDNPMLQSLVTTGNLKVMKTRRNRDTVHTSVQILVDQSSSMPTMETVQATILVAEAMAGILNLKLSIVGFMTENHRRRYDLEHGLQPGVGRLEPMTLYLFKDFEEDYNSARKRLGGMRTSGCTPLGEAYGHGFERLVRRTEPKRVLWIISDGEPYFSIGDGQHDDHILMDRIFRKCKRYGIGTFGMYIGTGSSTLGEYVEKYVQTTNWTQVPETVLAVIKGMIEVEDA